MCNKSSPYYPDKKKGSTNRLFISTFAGVCRSEGVICFVLRRERDYLRFATVIPGWGFRSVKEVPHFVRIFHSRPLWKARLRYSADSYFCRTFKFLRFPCSRERKMLPATPRAPLLLTWRRERDSNPRRCDPQRFSRPPHSTALPSLRLELLARQDTNKF